MMSRIGICILILFSVSTSLFGQDLNNRDDEKECVICHVQWHPDRADIQNLVPALETSIIIDGRAGIVSHEQMCLSCHDGYVNDSREVFESNNHKQNLDKSHIEIQDLPLGSSGQIYCGTCHTPHALKPKQEGGLAPFLREAANDSDLCLNCHSSSAEDHVNHPIKIKLNPDQQIPAGGKLSPDGTIECLTCHPIHGDRAVLAVEGDNRKELCMSCHEQYFQIELTDHDLPATLSTEGETLGPNLEGQDVCASCHSSHKGHGDMMWSQEIDATLGKNAYCITCHSEEGVAPLKAYSHTGHIVGEKILKKDIPALNIKRDEELLCTSCHDPHQWEHSRKHAVGSENEEGTEYTSFLKLPDDAQGQLCVACHTDQAEIYQSDHSVSREGFQQYFKESKTFKGQCSICHDTHGGNWQEEQVDKSRILCESCHNDEHYPTTVGGFDHPMDIALNESSSLPGYSGKITCITCHDPHFWGSSQHESSTVDLDGNDANSFLRMTNWPEPTLCLDCHEDQAEVLNTDHDLSNETHNACSFCHASHNASIEYGLVSAWDHEAGSTLNERICFSCHQVDGSAEEKIPGAWDHPREYGTISHTVRGTGVWEDFPLFNTDSPAEVVGFIDCFTCHDPHRWSFKPEVMVEKDKNEDGDYMTSFLRNPSYKTLCTDCHGANTLWKFNYYHDPVKRKRY